QSGMGYKENSDFSNLYYTTSSRPANSLVGYMESHDEERVSYKQTQWGVGTIKTDLATRMDQLKANAAFFFTVPGPKMIWQFGELG
ncbi:MAG TPA: alpha-amylase, partial [Porphyromonadaceae bacterium]|nr:alpha-amylase [Porphyromonadaceae bacterium]